MSSTLVYVICGVVALIILLTVLMILTRYKKCKSNELLVVYGKTKGNTAGKCYHGGSAFVWPVIQGYSIISMDPFQITCNLDNVLSKQNIEVDIKSVITVAVSTASETMQNAAVRLLGLDEDERNNQIKDIVYGQLRLIIAEMDIESLISDRTEFLKKCNDSISAELKKFGLDLMNINISDIKDHADYINNLGKEAASKAKYEALAKIEQRTKEGECEIAKQKKVKQLQLS
jgi:flotillin